MRILLDIDGVCGDWAGAVADVIRSVAGIEMDTSKWFELRHLPKQYRHKVESVIDSEGFCRKFKPLPGALEGVQELRNLGHEVHFVTSLWDSKTWVSDRNHWLRFWWLAPNAPGGVTYTKDKHVVYGDIFVDDKPENVRAWQAAWPDKVALLFDQPWNHHAEATRVTDWNNLLDYVKWRSAK